MDGQLNLHPSMINGIAMGWIENGTHLDSRFQTLDVLNKASILSSLTTKKEATLDAGEDTKMTKDISGLQLLCSIMVDVK